MSQIIKRHLEELALKDPLARREALEQVLTAEGLSYEIQEAPPSYKNPLGVKNFLLGSEEPAHLFCAHYDSVPGSFGANDNAAAVCILIDLAKELKRRQIPAKFAFFDGEEQDNAGSRRYCSLLDRKSLTAVINLDVCGYGDTIAICGHGHEKKPPLRPFSNKRILEKYNTCLLRYLPKSDDASFSGMRIPVLNMCTVPRWDVQYLKAMASYGGGFLGRPPEYDMMMEQMEVSTTMHGGFRDAPQWVEPEAMERMYAYLAEGMEGAAGKG